MNKKEFINFFNYEDKEFLGFLYDKIQLVSRTNKNVIINEFLPPNIWNKLEILKQYFNINIESWEVFKYSERKILIFYVDYIYEQFPLKILVIENKSKFKILKHKDYLGALMSLGIKREMLGDLIVENNSCYVPIVEDMEDYILYNLQCIGKCSCNIRSYDIHEISIPDIQFDVINVIVTSMRLDCIISAIINESRNISVSLISKGKVLINYNEEYRKDKNILENDILTIRGYGKYKIKEVIGFTNKNRLKINVLKFK